MTVDSIIGKAEREILMSTGQRVKLYISKSSAVIVENDIKPFAETWGVPVEYLSAKTRKREVVIMRQIVIHYMMKVKGLSSTFAGAFFGFDHTTAIYHNNNAATLIRISDSLFMHYYNQVKHFFND